MLMKKKGFPEDEEIVLCTVKKILPNSIFVELDEYENKEGVIHISEISPGRIRNIRDFVRESKKIICKILRTDKEKGHIDVSLRRVTSSQRKEKNDELKQEEKAEKILESLAIKLNKKPIELYKTLTKEEDTSLYRLFQSISEDNSIIADLKLDKKLEKELLVIINERIKPAEVIIKEEFNLESTKPDGIKRIKSVIKKLEEHAHKNKKEIEIIYISAPRYRLTLKDSDYKSAEANLKELIDLASELMKKENAQDIKM